MKSAPAHLALAFVTTTFVVGGAAVGLHLHRASGTALEQELRQQDGITHNALRSSFRDQIEDTLGLLDTAGRLFDAGASPTDPVILSALTPAARSWLDGVCVRDDGLDRCARRNFAGVFVPTPRTTRVDPATPPEHPIVVPLSAGQTTVLEFRVPLAGAPGWVTARGTLRGLVRDVLTTIHLPGGNQIEVYDADGRIRYHPQGSYVGLTWAEIESREQPLNDWDDETEATEARARALFISGNSGRTRYTDNNYGGTAMLARYGPFPGVPGLFLVYNRGLSSFDAARRSQAWIGTSTGALSGLVFALVFGLWRAAEKARRQQGRELDLAEERNRAQAETERLIDGMSAWVFTVGPDHTITRANLRLREYLMGRGIADPIGEPCQGVMPPEMCDLCKQEEVCSARRPVTFEAPIDGRPHLVNQAPLRMPDGRVEVLHLIEDVSHLRALQGALQESERRGTAAVLAGSIAHEINNAVTGAYGYAELLADRPDDAALARKASGVFVHQLERVAALARNLQSLSRPSEPTKELVNLTPLFRELAERLAAGGVTKRFEVETSWTDLPPVVCDPGLIEQALTNLTLNATHAMGDEGVLRLGTDRTDDTVRLWVADTGPGIHPDDRKHLFEAFFTTKGEQGTGLGLYVTQQIVDAHGGTVEVKSRPGRGVRFTLVLPMGQAKG